MSSVCKSLCLLIFLLGYSLFVEAQTVMIVTECSASDMAIGEDRNDFGGALSEGYLNNFDVPAETSTSCASMVTEMTITIDINNIDLTGMPAGCALTSFFGNVLVDAGTLPFSGGCCAVSQNVMTESCGNFVGTPPATGSYSLEVVGCGVSVPMGGTVGVDIIAVTSGGGCSSSPLSDGDIIIDYTICIDFEITIPDEPTVDAGPDVTIGCDESVLIGADPIAVDFEDGWTYDWSNGAGNGILDGSDNGQVTVSPTSTTIYTVTVTDQFGCSSTDEVEVFYDCCPNPGCVDNCAETINTWDNIICECVFIPPAVDDGCALTTDSYDFVNCMILNVYDNSCDDGCAETDDVLNIANCECEYLAPDPDDGCPLTNDSYDAVLCMIVNEAPSCDDACPDTVDSFDALNCQCINAEPTCDDGCAETTDSFDIGSCTCVNDEPDPDDGCPLTVDTYDTVLCMIVNTPPSCDDNCPDTIDSFDALSCQCNYVEPDCDDGCIETTDSFDAVTCNCINDGPDPDDGCPLTTDSFDLLNCEIINEEPDCDDACNETTDTFNAIDCACENVGPDCDDGCALTIDSFDSVTCNCINEEPVVDDGCALTTDSFDVLNCEIINEEPDCDDTCAETTDTFNATDCACENIGPDCDDGCALTVDTYDSLNCECNNEEPNIDDGCALTTDSFDALNCEIINEEPDCDDNCSETVDSFNATDCACENVGPNCDDGCALTIDSYDSFNCECNNEEPPVDDACALTIDSFDEITCQIINLEPDCDDGCNQTIDSFNATDCECLNVEPDCDDGCPATIDSFDSIACDCLNEEPDPDDDCALTEDSYDAVLCMILNLEPDCDDGCIGTIDSFDIDNCECLNIEPDCDDGCDATFDFYDPVACDCIFEDPDPDDGCDNTIDSFDPVLCMVINEEPVCDDFCNDTIDFFDTGTCDCAIEEPECDDNCDSTPDFWDPFSCECFSEIPEVDDGCDLTTDFWDVDNCIVVNTPPDCDDGDCGTSDVWDFDNCLCINDTDFSCDDGCDLTTDSYDQILCECIFTAPPVDDGCDLTTDSFNEVTCMVDNIPISCDDGDCATVDSFDVNICACVNEVTDTCDDGCDLTTDSYDSILCECVFEMPDPDDSCDQTDDSFDAVNCIIVNTPIACDDNCDLTVDTFDFVTCNCNSEQPDCDDGDPTNGVEIFDVNNCECITTTVDLEDPMGSGISWCEGEDVESFDIQIPLGTIALWFDMPGGNQIGEGADWTPPGAGTYYVLADDQNGNQSNTLELNAEELSVPDVTMIESISCDTDNGTWSFSMELENGNIEDLPADALISSMGDIYEVSNIPIDENFIAIAISALSGCEQTIEIAAPDCSCPIFLDLGVDQNLNCDGNGLSLANQLINQGEAFDEVNWYDEAGTILSMDENFTVNEPGVFIMVGIDLDNNCTVEDTIEIFDAILPDVEINSINGLVLDCEEEILNFSITNEENNVEYTWEQNGDIIIGSSFETISEGTITLTAINEETECVDQMQIDITSNIDYPVIIFEEVFLGCDPPTVDISAIQSDIGPNFTHQWYDDNFELIDGAISPILLFVSSPGNYSLETTNTDNGCVTINTYTLTDISNFPLIEAGPDQIIECGETSIFLDASAGTSLGAELLGNWVSLEGNMILDENSLMPEVFGAGTYVLELYSTVSGCTSRDTLMVEQGVFTIDDLELIIDQPDCLGSPNGSIFISTNMSGIMSYSIGDDSNEDGVFENLLPGTYELIITNDAGCTLPLMFVINEIADFNFDINPKVYEVAFGGLVNLTLETDLLEAEIGSITINPEIDLSCSACLTPSFTAIASENYTLTLIDENGCEKEVDIQVIIKNEVNIFVPNIYNPEIDFNGYTIYSNQSVVVQDLSIFDRWGNRIFEKKNFMIGDPEAVWNGYYNNSYVQPGVYVIKIEYLDEDGQPVLIVDDLTFMGN